LFGLPSDVLVNYINNVNLLPNIVGLQTRRG
jgi:hypothetical protein